MVKRSTVKAVCYGCTAVLTLLDTKEGNMSIIQIGTLSVIFALILNRLGNRAASASIVAMIKTLDAYDESSPNKKVWAVSLAVVTLLISHFSSK